ncbi:TPA_asm: maturation protein [ssRNA phage ESO010]|uniref:Maturation protein n=1 Tax=ssRNA phage ESO010 TaxID=2786010 RepID=A0A8S5KX82_9VIRU|nr:maturation protein [ssRNA phage ESO010]DAD49926.1 TPA_asm: maturation protein [ssRNA phage ESO010]
MTTGNTDIDTRINTAFTYSDVFGSNTQYGLIGWRTLRNWGGADYSNSQKPDKNVRYRDRDLPYQGRYSVYGMQVAPRRSRIEDHGYSTVASRIYYGTASWLYPFNPFDPNTPYLTRQFGHANGFGTYGVVQGWTSNDFLSLLGKLREKITGSSFNLAVAAAEASQGLGMIASAAVKINRAYGQVRRGRWAAAGRTLTGVAVPPRKAARMRPGSHPDAVANNWLELQYGWRPLLGDVFDACASLAHFLNTPLIKSYRASRKVLGTSFTGTPTQMVWGTSDVYTRVSIIARVREASVPALLGLTDPASVVWEKLPFSFVADWFLPIGSWLSSRGLSSSMSATYVISRKVYASVGAPRMIGDGIISYPGFTSDFSGQDVAFSREVTSSLDVPLPELKPLGKWLTWQHAANAVALVVTAASRPNRPGRPIDPNRVNPF